MKVFVKDLYNRPLMPTTPRKARVLLKQKRASVVQRNPFTIKLLYPTGSAVQPVVLGIDSGYLNIGFSAITEKEELLAGEVKLLDKMIERNRARSMYRRSRRNRLWHRRKRYNLNKNKKGWLAPSIRHKFDSHLQFIDKLAELLPITKIILETANIDIQKIKNPGISGKEYQEGAQKGYDNVKAYVLHRDGYKCQNPDCKNKQSQTGLHVHHIQCRGNGGSNRPDNLITLCVRCHTPENHKGFLLTWKPAVKGFKPETFMSTVRKMILKALEQKFDVKETFGYLTKEKRFDLGLEKSHLNDAFCIAGGKSQLRHKPFTVIQIRRNNRSLSKFYDAKYTDSRDGSIRYGKELFCGRTVRNKNLQGENLRIYRLKKDCKGRFNRRKTRPKWHSLDLVEYNGKRDYIYYSHNCGKRIVLRNLGQSVAVSKIKIVKYGQGFCWIDPKVGCY